MSQIIEERDRNEDTSIIRYWTSTSVPTPRGVLRDEDFRMWIEWLERDGQLAPGKVAPSDLYTNQFQPEPLAER